MRELHKRDTFWKAKTVYYTLVAVLSSQFFTEILHADRGTLDMKHIKWDFSLKAWVLSLGGLRGWDRGQN